MGIVYADNNATTAIAPDVYESMKPYLTDEYFNPSSMYGQSSGPAEAISTARTQVASLLNADTSEVFFTSCATESNNTALRGVAKANPQRNHIITTEVEHPAVREVCFEMEKDGYEVTYLSVDNEGRLDTSEFVRALRSDTLLVTIMHANNETGVIFPIEDLARITKETDPRIVFHSDATQSPGKLSLDLRHVFTHVDLLSLSGHKLHAPKGVGALYVREGTRIRPFMSGGHQEGGFRAGTENVPHIVGMGRACELALDQLTNEQDLSHLRDRLENGIEQRVPYVDVNGKNAPRLPNTLNIACHYVEGEGILYQLDDAGICVSSGSACTSGSLEPSHVLKAMGVPFTALHGSVRFSLSRYNTRDEVDYILEVFPDIIHNLRRLSPYWDERSNQPRSENAMST